MRAVAILILLFTVSCAKSIQEESESSKVQTLNQKPNDRNLTSELEKQQQLKLAIITSSTNLVRSALYRGASPNKIKIGFENALTYAIKNDQNSIFNILVSAGANTNLKNEYNESPIHLAVEKNDSILTRILINKKDTDINCVNTNGETPLVLALKQKNKRLALMLISAKANLESKNDNEEIEELALKNFNEKFYVFIKRLRLFNHIHLQEQILKNILETNDTFTLRYIKMIHEDSSVRLSTNFVKSIFLNADEKTIELMINTIFTISNFSIYTQYLLLIESFKFRNINHTKLIYSNIKKPNPNFYDNMDRTLLSHAVEYNNYDAALFLRRIGAETYFETKEDILINSCNYLKKRRLTRRSYRNFQNMLGC